MADESHDIKQFETINHFFNTSDYLAFIMCEMICETIRMISLMISCLR